MQKKPNAEIPAEKTSQLHVLPQPMLTPEEMQELRQESQAAMREFREHFRRREKLLAAGQVAPTNRKDSCENG